MKFWTRFDNPFLLVVEGFVAGALLFWATSHGSVGRTKEPAAVSAEASARHN